ncbi:ATP-grasp domain-containing protein [Enterococcus sp. 2201sp1_2201st1_B8_2201SCRN_220225]|uniref:ATP-grasp domain-containing protein n=1 Tax=unclassified Enterococcus TaxID=2608891 RepID=UPI0034A59474
MNGLILSCGTRNKIIQYFKKELEPIGGKIYGADASKLAPALYECDEFFIIPEFTAPDYIDVLLNICKNKKVSFLLSLIDTELTIIAKNKELFETNGIKVIGPSFEMAKRCLNKKAMYQYFNEIDIPTQKSYFSIDSFKRDYDDKKISFPVFVKPISGSASIGISKVDTYNSLSNLFDTSNLDLMIQENMDGAEYGVDCYIDLVTGDLIDFFIKKKIKMRAGETDKSVSIINEEISDLVKQFVSKSQGFFGPIDIDIFEKNGHYYVSEINPRFGGGYPHAYECGVNFMSYTIKNIGETLQKKQYLTYKSGIYMMKYNEVTIKSLH